MQRNCRADQSRAVRAAAEHVGADPRVEAVSVIDPDDGPRSGWVLDVITADPGHTPHSVQRRLTERNAGIVETTPQGPGHRQVLAVVEVR